VTEVTINGYNINADHEHIALNKHAYPDVQVGTVIRLLRNGEIVAEWRIARQSSMEMVGDRIHPRRQQYADNIFTDLLRYSGEG
jgi:hypothetical protein